MASPAYKRLVARSRDSRSAFKKVQKARRGTNLSFSQAAIVALKRQDARAVRSALRRRERLDIAQSALLDESLGGPALSKRLIGKEVSSDKEALDALRAAKREVDGAFLAQQKAHRQFDKAELERIERKLEVASPALQKSLVKAAAKLRASLSRKRKLSDRQRLAILNEEYTVLDDGEEVRLSEKLNRWVKRRSERQARLSGRKIRKKDLGGGLTVWRLV